MPRPALLAGTLMALLAVLGACDSGSREERFCESLVEDRALLATVPTDPGDLDDFVERYRRLGDIAPLAIEEQWQTITDLIVAVATGDLTDPATADRLRDQAVAATRPVNEVRLYARQTCGLDLLVAGVPQVPATAVTTAPAGTPTTPAPGATPATPATSTTPPTTVPGTVPPTVP